ncbi:FAD:protein FMN transferase [hydrothermal vent metagenome]|uniref:FAD:protein FMN transferase n=1 Tax=hydrothermal vent metagenome TaxID=652676 RepID=A0A3B0X1E1_9ZZZZ
MRTTELKKENDFLKGTFMAMASPCDVLMEIENESLAQDILNAVAEEAWRIEDKFSRYKKDNIIFKINHSHGKTVAIDEETSRLFDFANELFEISEGLFDVTSGVLRQIWKFDGSDNVPTKKQIKKIIKNIGWQKVNRENCDVTLLKDMEIDLGGIGKEYAVDRCVQIARKKTKNSVLVNFGGDLAMTTARKNNAFWSVGRLVTGSDEACGLFQLYRGAIATSGDANRYLIKKGVRYSHILNPKTGRSIIDAPHTISVAAPTCVEAGMMSTLAMLQGGQAEEFLKLQDVDYWVD